MQSISNCLEDSLAQEDGHLPIISNNLPIFGCILSVMLQPSLVPLCRVMSNSKQFLSLGISV